MGPDLWMPRVKRLEDGWKQQRLHFTDSDGDRMFASLEECDGERAYGAKIDVSEYEYINLSSDRLRRLAYWVDYARVEQWRWEVSADYRRWAEDCLGSDPDYTHEPEPCLAPPELRAKFLFGKEG